MVTAPPSAPPSKPAVSRLPPPPEPVRSPAPSVSTRTRDLAARLREAAAGTPGTMRLLGIGCVVVLIVFGVLGALAANSRAGAIDDAKEQAAQLVRLQTVRTSLVQADALATNAFLLAGLEPAGQREDYLAELDNASAALTDAASHSDPADADALRGVNSAIATYSGLIESARANNRQGFPVGVAYLKQASSELQDNVLPTLAELTDTTQSRVKQAYRDSRTSINWLVAGSAIAIVALVITQGYLTVRTRRLVSVPILVSACIVVGAAVIAAGVMSWSLSQADDVRDGDYARTVALAQARIFAFDAKSAESLTLIKRGSGAADEVRFQTLSTAARDTLQAADVRPQHIEALTDYLRIHDDVREADDSGQWDAAVGLATQAEGGSNAAFQRFADSTSDELADTASSISDDLDDARLPLTILAVVLVLAGIAAAIAAWQGVSVRLKEYR